jgi:hypothetical protein
VSFDHGFLSVPVTGAEVAGDDDAFGFFALHGSLRGLVVKFSGGFRFVLPYAATRQACS